MTERIVGAWSSSDNVADIMDSVDVLSSTETGYLDSVTPGTAAASKAVVLSATLGISTINTATITSLTATNANCTRSVATTANATSITATNVNATLGLITTVNGTSATFTKVQLNAEDFDTDSCFDSTTNYRFTPTKSGYYLLGGSANWNGGSTTGVYDTLIYKNGVAVAQVGRDYQTGVAGLDLTTGGGAGTLLYMNGSTDYVELYVWQNSGGAVNLYAAQGGTWLHGIWIRS